MRLYVILDKITNTEYGITNKLWLARLFYLQRHETNRNMIIICRKSKMRKGDLLYHDLNLYYFSGFALLDDEIQYVNYNILDAGIEYYKKKYKKKRFQHTIDHIEKAVINNSIMDCIYRKYVVLDRLYCLNAWQSKVGGNHDYCD